MFMIIEWGRGSEVNVHACRVGRVRGKCSMFVGWGGSEVNVHACRVGRVRGKCSMFVAWGEHVRGKCSCL